MAGGVQIALLRGVNVGGHNRLPMPELRERLETEGCREVRTYLQSGNVVLRSTRGSAATGALIGKVVAEMGVQTPVVMRTRSELEAIVERAPLGDVASDDAKLLVIFLSEKLGKQRADAIAGLDVAPDQLLVDGREIHAWCPQGASSPRVAKVMTPARLGQGVAATGRNWKTVLALAELAKASGKAAT